LTAVGLLFPGEMGTAVGRAVRGDVLWASEGRSEATRKRAAPFRDAGSVTELVRSSEVILSICPPAIAETVAEEVFAAGFDGSIIASDGIHLYLAGEGSDEIAALFADGDVRAIRLEAEIGAASALKMAFGGWNKIGIALTAQARAIALEFGVQGWLDEEGVPADRLSRVADRAWRWAPEMDEIAATCADIGLHHALPRAAAEFYRDLAT
jgi:hypothetical protein